jgi:hypothetical protein
MICPICGKVAKTPTGLRRHLTGTRPYGGHLLTGSEAAFTAAAAAQIPESETEADAFLAKALQRLISNKKLPKYQFERAVDAFLGVFLPEIVGLGIGERARVSLVAQEFPLKRPDDNRSTNVDYVLFSDAAGERPWIFLELKTDPSSMKDSQALVYANRLIDTPMSELFDEMKHIMKATNKVAKYQSLVERFRGYEPPPGKVRVVYLTPNETSATQLLPKTTAPELVAAFDSILTTLSFEGLRELRLKTYPKTWVLFRDAVVPAIRGSDAARD